MKCLLKGGEGKVVMILCCEYTDSTKSEF